MISAEKLSIVVGERLRDLNETPESLVDSIRELMRTMPQDQRASLEREIQDAEFVRPALSRQLPDLKHITVRRVERALGFSEFTLFALSSDGRGIPEFGEEVI